VPEARAFSLPERPRTQVRLWLLALALHVPLILLAVRRARMPIFPLFEARPVTLSDSVHPAVMPRFRHTASAVNLVPPSGKVAAGPAARAQYRDPATAPVPTVISAAAPLPVDTPPSRVTTTLQPHYGDGRLWVRPLAESPRTIARTLTGKTDKQLTDSAVAAMVQTYLDAMAREEAANPTTLPSWTTHIAGKTVGIDAKWIYLGPIKVPTALLALLPIRVTGNMSNYQYNQQLQLMRSDLFEAARRAATYDDFKQAVKDLRAQTEETREFRKNQRTPPDTGHHG
jgi:hypothetical protein